MELTNLISQEGIQLINDIRANMGSAGMNVTNETSHSLEFQIKQDGPNYKFTLLGRPYFMTVQTGRRPTPGKKPSREMVENIGKWLEGRGMDMDSAWAVATKIQEKGTKLFQAGGRTDIVDPAVESFLDNLSKNMLEVMSDDMVTRLTAEINGGNRT